MKTTAATFALTILFLSAGAFAQVNGPANPAAALNTANLTVIEKNRNWPILVETPISSCTAVRCIDI